MGRQTLALGTWGKINTIVHKRDANGKPRTYRAKAAFRDFDGVIRDVYGYGKCKAMAQSDLHRRLTERQRAGHGNNLLKSSDRFRVAADLWLKKFAQLVEDGRRSPGSFDAYTGHLERTLLPRLGDLRLGEMTTPLLDTIIGSIRQDIGASTARSCRSIVSGVLGLAVRYGAIGTNPVRDVERIESPTKSVPRALTDAERIGWFEMIMEDQEAVRNDLPDLTMFMLATGVRIGESLGVLCDQVDLSTGEVEVTHQIIRVKGKGLIRKVTKSRAGERVLRLPAWCLSLLERRFADGSRPAAPIFASATGGFRDPANVRRDLRAARSPFSSQARRDLVAALAEARRSAGLSQAAAATALGWSRHRTSVVERARIKITEAEILEMLRIYKVDEADRMRILGIADQVVNETDDAFSWLTSHVFRKTTATILDDAGQSARQVADQLGHSRTSMTQDHYIGRRARNPAAAVALECAVTWPKQSNQAPDRSDFDSVE